VDPDMIFKIFLSDSSAASVEPLYLETIDAKETMVLL
jgi:hypothetical protein